MTYSWKVVDMLWSVLSGCYGDAWHGVSNRDTEGMCYPAPSSGVRRVKPMRSPPIWKTCRTIHFTESLTAIAHSHPLEVS